MAVGVLSVILGRDAGRQFLLQGFLPGAGPGPQELGRQPDFFSLLFQTLLY